MPFKSNRPKLVKPRSSDTSLLQAQLDDYNELNRSRTSFSDLRSARRPALPRQHTGSTIDADVGTAADMAPSNKRLTRTVSASALDQEFVASTTTINSLDFKRDTSGTGLEGSKSPPVPDIKSSKLDVEQAINLLQELKKSASPEELVSLHRALLPTKDASPGAVPQLSSIEEHVAYSSSAAPRDRIRSAIPPGLATRSGISGDPLRSQEEIAKMTEASKEKKGAWFSESSPLSSPLSNLRTRTRTLSLVSTGTAPDTTSVQTGGYGAGTLRVMNGRASPEPGIITKLAAEKEGEVAKIEQVDGEKQVVQETPTDRSRSAAPKEGEVANTKQIDGEKQVVEETPTNRPRPAVPQRLSLDVQMGRGSLDSARTNPPLSLAERRQKQWGLRTTTAPVGPTPIPTPQYSNTKAKADDRVELPSQKNSKRRTVGNSADLQVSTTDLPRFGQRWAHRAAHLSKEYTADCDITSSPYEEEFDAIKRLSTVHDNEDGEAATSATDACAEALMKLNGGSDVATDGSDAEEEPSAVATSSDGSKPSSVSHLDQRFRVVRKQDSGYYSEASNCSSPPQPSVFTSTFLGKELEPTPEQPAELETPAPSPVPTVKPDERPRTREGVDSDVASLITMHEQLGATPSPTATPSPRPEVIKLNAPPPEKKSFSPLSLFRSRNRANKRASVAAAEAAAETKSAEKADRVVARATSMQTLSGDYAAARQSMDGKRRLQKRMPDAVRLRQSMDVSLQARDIDSPTSSPPVPTVHQGSSTQTKTGKTVFHNVPPHRNVSDGDDESKSTSSAPEKAEKSISSWRRRSKSFARKRSSTTIQESKAEESPAPSLPSTPSSTPSRRRSRSIVNFGFGSRRQSADSAGISSAKATEPVPKLSVDVSSHKDFSSVARALDSAAPHDNPKDSKTNSVMPKTMTKIKSSKNLRARASADFMNTKNRDTQSTSTKHELPETVQETEMMATNSSQRTVEDLFPEWEGKPAALESNPAAMEAQILQAFPYAGASKVASDCIPPLPELPADMDQRVCKADLMLAKKLKSPKSSPRSSVDSVQVRKMAAAKTAPKARPEPSKLAVESKPRAEEEAALFDAESVHDAPLASTDAAHPRFSFEEIPKPGVYLPYRPAAAKATSPTHDAKHPGWPGWETQSSLWMQKRTTMESTPTFKPQTFDEKIPVDPEEATSPAIVVSRYITPPTAENTSKAMSRDRKNSAPSAVPSTPDQLESNNESPSLDAGLMRTGSMLSTATYVTMWSADERPSKVNVGRSSGAFSTTTTTTTLSTASSRTSYATDNSSSSSLPQQQQQQQSGQNRNRSSSQAGGSYLPYRPTDSVVAERSRALNKARRSCNTQNEEAKQLRLSTEDRPPPPPRRSTDIPDRYSGGLGYGWDRETGFSGSAGTHSRNASTDTVNAPRKSQRSIESYGIDLTDVPIFLQRRPI